MPLICEMVPVHTLRRKTSAAEIHWSCLLARTGRITQTIRDWRVRSAPAKISKNGHYARLRHCCHQRKSRAESPRCVVRVARAVARRGPGLARGDTGTPETRDDRDVVSSADPPASRMVCPLYPAAASESAGLPLSTSGHGPSDWQRPRHCPCAPARQAPARKS